MSEALADHTKKRERSILAFFATSIAARGIGIGCQLLQVPIALKHLGNEAFGLWVTLFSFGFIIAFSDFGIGLGVQNKVAEALGREDRVEGRRVFVTGFLFLCGIALALLAIFVPLCLLLDLPRMLGISDPLVAESTASSVLIVVLIWCITVPIGLGQRVALGAQLGWAFNAASTISQVVLLAAVFAGAWMKVGISFFFFLTFAGGFLVNLGFLIYLLRRLGWAKIDLSFFEASRVKELAQLGGFFFLQQIATIVMFLAPPLILSAALGAAAVTPYSLTQRVLNVFMVVANAVLVPLWPAYSEAKAKSDWLWIRRTLLRSLLIVLTMAILPMLIAGPFVRTLITWWTGASAELPSQTLVWLLIAWNSLTVLQQPFGYFLAGISKVRRATVYSILSTALALGVIFFLIPEHGANALPLGLIAGCLPFMFFGNVLETLMVLRPALRRQRETQDAGVSMLPNPEQTR
jgi:O-antigen/teichoic acid export membrane protein